MVGIIFGILFVVSGIGLISVGVSNLPKNTHYRNIPDGRYTTTTDFTNDIIVVKDVYGKTVITYRRSPND